MLLSLYVHNILISNIIIIIIIIHFRTTVYNALSVSLSFCLLQWFLTDWLTSYM